MTSQHLSSGDLIADRRAAYAKMLADSGDFSAAAELMEQALEIAPSWAAGWFLSGEYLEKAGNDDLAVPSYRRVLELVNEDIFGAGLKLSVLGAREQPNKPPVAYVEQLFDDYADHFEEALLEKLDYQVPARLKDLILAHSPDRFDCVVDLGCGTGLMALEIGSYADRLEGFDLSANMLAKAEEKGLYHHLAQIDLSTRDASDTLFGPELPESRADLAVAADVLMYLGDLDNLFSLVRRVLAPKGRFAFSIELSTEEEGFHLQPSLRFAHTERYIVELMQRYAFQMVATKKLIIRMDGGAPVHGILFFAQYSGNA